MSTTTILNEYLLEELEKPNPSVGTIILADIYLILLDQGGSRKELHDALAGDNVAKEAFINRLAEKQSFSKRVIGVAMTTIIGNPQISKMLRDCVGDIRSRRSR